MEFRFSDEHEAFRGDVRRFIQENWEEPPYVPGDAQVQFQAERAYQHKLAQHGWLTMAWPEEYGGRGASFIQQLIFREESAYAGAPGAGGQGIGMVGPCLMVHGSEEQRQRFLPAIANAEVAWCQGFSEPGSGSDLASLTTRAVRDGDDFVINGQKIWASNAHFADWLHVLVRTDPDAPKHRGISYFLVDMRTSGIDVRPLINMGGDHGFNETFLTDVRVPADQMLGEENRGWYVAATTLDFERSGVHYAATARRTIEQIIGWAKETRSGANGPRVWDNPAVQHKIAEAYIEQEAARLLSYRVAWMQSRELIPNYEASMSKVYGTELSQRIFNLGVQVLGLPAQQVDPNDPRAPLGARIGRGYVHSRSATIAAGTSEIQRNIIATRGLGLPR